MKAEHAVASSIGSRQLSKAVFQQVKRFSVCTLFCAMVPGFAFAQAAASRTQPKAVSQAASKPTVSASETVSPYSADFAAGEELFQLNKPEEAIPLFENVLKEPQPNPSVYVYLGVAYYQIKEYQRSLDVCVIGMAKQGTDKKILAYNAGNSAYAMSNYARAESCYALSLHEDENFASAHLNIANAQLKQDHLEDARENYVRFLELEPENVQKEAIEELIRLLDEELERRANEKPELILPEDLDILNDAMQSPAPEMVEESEAPVLPAEPKKADGERIESDAQAPVVPASPTPSAGERVEGEKQAPAMPLVPAKDSGERIESEAPSAVQPLPKQQPYGEELLKAADAAAGAVPEESKEQASSGEVVKEPALPAPQTKPDPRDKPMEAVDGEDGDLPPTDYWDDAADDL